MIHDSWIHNHYTRVAAQAARDTVPNREQPVAPADAYVSGARPAVGGYGAVAGNAPQSLQEPGASEGGTLSPMAEAAATVSGAVTGSLLGPGGGSILQTLSALPPALGRAIESAELEVKERKLDQRIQEMERALNALAASQAHADAHAFDQVETERAAAEKDIAQRQAAIDQRRGAMTLSAMWRNAQMNAEETSLAEKERNREQVARTLAEQRRAEMDHALDVERQQRQGGLEAREHGLVERQAGLDLRDREFDAIVSRECDMRLEQTSAMLQASLAQRKAAVDDRAAALQNGEADLQARKVSMKDQVAREAERLRGLRETELNNGLYAVDDRLRRDHDDRQDELKQAHAAQERRLAEELRSREAALKAPLADDTRRISQLTSQAHDLRNQVATWESSISRTKANASEVAARAARLISALEYDRTQLANAAYAAQTEAQTLDGQLRNEKYELQTQFRAMRDAREGVGRARREIGHLQSTNSALQDQIANLRWRL